MKGIGFVAALILTAIACPQPSTTSRLSFRSAGQQLQQPVTDIDVNADARYCAFSTADPNVVQADTNGVADVFVRDYVTGNVTRISVSTSGEEGNAASYAPSLSNGGRYIAFVSEASNLVVGDTNGVADVFLHDAITGITSRLSVRSDGGQADGPSSEPDISANGRYVAFTSVAKNFIDDDDNGVSDIFRHDRQFGETTCFSLRHSSNEVGNGPSDSPSIHPTGGDICFASDATDLTPVDTNGFRDVFVSPSPGSVGRVSRGESMLQGNGPSYDPDYSPDGNYIVYASDATNFFFGDTNNVSDFFIMEMTGFETEHIRIGSGVQPNGDSRSPKLSSDRRQIAFLSSATNLVANDTNGVADVFVFDFASQVTTMASRSSLGDIADGESRSPGISNNGKVAFVSGASNLIPSDTNGIADAFLHDIFTTWPTAASLSRGVAIAGGHVSLIYADGLSWNIKPSVTMSSSQHPIVVVAESRVIRTAPLALAMIIRSGANTANLRQVIEWYDFTIGAFVEVDRRPLAIGLMDYAVSFGHQEAQKFISPRGTVKMRVSMRADGPTLIFPWQIQIDQIRWIIYE